MYHRLYYHVVWTTRDRAPLIDRRVALFLCRFLRATAKEEGVRVLEVGMVRTHVHLLLAAPIRADWSRVLQRLKGASAQIANRGAVAPGDAPLRWAKGYSIHTVSPRAVPAARAYLQRQPEHHPDQAIPDWEGDRERELEMRGAEVRGD